MSIPKAKGILKKIDGLLKKKDPGPIPGAKGFLREISEAVVKKADDPGPFVCKTLEMMSSNPQPSKTKKGKGKGKVEFYWQYCEQEDIPRPCFTITPKKYFDATGALSDRGYGSEDFPEGFLPEGFVESQESEYEFNGTREEAEALLRVDPKFEEMFKGGARE